MRKFIIIAIAITVGGIAKACPNGQREECVVPTPWGCQEKICVPNILIDIPNLNRDQNISQSLQGKSKDTATDNTSFDN